MYYVLLTWNFFQGFAGIGRPLYELTENGHSLNEQLSAKNHSINLRKPNAVNVGIGGVFIAKVFAYFSKAERNYYVTSREFVVITKLLEHFHKYL